jgi:hypothetical protein
MKDMMKFEKNCEDEDRKKSLSVGFQRAFFTSIIKIVIDGCRHTFPHSVSAYWCVRKNFKEAIYFNSETLHPFQKRNKISVT